MARNRTRLDVPLPPELATFDAAEWDAGFVPLAAFSAARNDGLIRPMFGLRAWGRARVDFLEAAGVSWLAASLETNRLTSGYRDEIESAFYAEYPEEEEEP